MSLPKPSAKIWIDYDKKKVMLSAPYNQHFNQLVRTLPRLFNKETKVWEFEIEFIDQIIDIAFRAWTNVIRPPFLLMEIFEHLTEDDLKDMYGNLTKRHRMDEDKTLLDLLNKFFGDYIDLTEMMRKKKRMIRLEPAEEVTLSQAVERVFTPHRRLNRPRTYIDHPQGEERSFTQADPPDSVLAMDNLQDLASRHLRNLRPDDEDD